MPLPPLTIAVAGLGEVGAAVVSGLAQQAEALVAKLGRRLRVVAVSARDRQRPRACPLDGITWYDNPLELATAPGIDVVVELIGGTGVARELICKTLDNRRAVVTANKSLLAHHGATLAQRAQEARVHFGYEAAVAGGIPVIKTLKQALVANHLDRIYGILNGTSNFILSQMAEQGESFAQSLAQAQARGYAEADPSNDIHGHDAAQKLALCATLAFGTRPEVTKITLQGISEISPQDFISARNLGYTIKLVAYAARSADGLCQWVAPCLIPSALPLAKVSGVSNAVVIEGAPIGRLLLEGPGAGGPATASAVIADLADVATTSARPAFGRTVADLTPLQVVPSAANHYAAYLRLTVKDRSGVLAEIAALLSAQQISLAHVIQHGREPEDAVPLIVITHETSQQRLNSALERINRLESVCAPTQCLRILNLDLSTPL